MTDNEIIKALERCNNPILTCEGCPLDQEVSCMTFIKTNILDLIKRQQAEINQFADLGKMYSEIKAEAIIEFIKKLKEKKHECGCNYRKKPVYAVTEEKIDETYKEMVGDA